MSSSIWSKGKSGRLIDRHTYVVWYAAHPLRRPAKTTCVSSLHRTKKQRVNGDAYTDSSKAPDNASLRKKVRINIMYVHPSRQGLYAFPQSWETPQSSSQPHRE